MLSKKDIVEINNEFDKGVIVNGSSLDYVIEETRMSRNWLKALALLVRAILVDHIFADGNKRTAAAVIMACLEMRGFVCDQDKVGGVVILIIKENITDVRKIERLIKNVIK